MNKILPIILIYFFGINSAFSQMNQDSSSLGAMVGNGMLNTIPKANYSQSPTKIIQMTNGGGGGGFLIFDYGLGWSIGSYPPICIAPNPRTGNCGCPANFIPLPTVTPNYDGTTSYLHMMCM